MPFYARYPATIAITGLTETVQGPGTPGTPTGGVLTIQGNASGTPVPISGNITASNAAVGPTGSAVPASADYVGYSVGGTLTGATGTSSGLNTVINAPIPAGTNKIGALTTVDTVTAVTTVSTVTAVTTVSTVAAVTAITNALPVGANVIGKVSIDQTTPGTTNAVAVISAVQPTTTTAAFQAEGAVAFGTITASYVTLFTPSASTKILQMRNNMNAAVAVSFDAGTTTNYTLDSGDSVSLDLFSNGLVMSTTAIQVKYAVGAPTSGSFRINGGH